MYFESPGKENTAKTIEIATQAIKNYDIRHVVLATTTGYTAQCFPALDGVNVVCIPHAYGFKEPGKNELTDETIQQLREKDSRYTPLLTPSAGQSGGLPANSAALPQ